MEIADGKRDASEFNCASIELPPPDVLHPINEPAEQWFDALQDPDPVWMNSGHVESVTKLLVKNEPFPFHLPSAHERTNITDIKPMTSTGLSAAMSGYAVASNT
jgi:hypothetical protein